MKACYENLLVQRLLGSEIADPRLYNLRLCNIRATAHLHSFDCFDLTGLDRFDEFVVVLFCLVGVADQANRLVLQLRARAPAADVAHDVHHDFGRKGELDAPPTNGSTQFSDPEALIPNVPGSKLRLCPMCQ